jgi:5-methyltetrahydrofolate--homocysteine methyltransferase
MENILHRLQRGDVIVGDGAFGTMLMQRGLKRGEPPESYNLEKPDVLEEIATLYLQAGAEIVSTNTFGASPLRLQQFFLDGQMESINRNAVDAVRRAVQDKAYISASIGPSSKMIKPFGKTEAEEVYASFEHQLRVLLDAGVDMICIETMIDVVEAGLAIKAARSLDSTIPIMTTMTFGNTPRGYHTFMGTSVKKATEELEKAGANIIGSNCGNGMDNMVAIAREFRKHAHVPIAIQGNAGLPVAEGTTLVYPESPRFVADKTIELLDIGVQVIGGCCGTQPEHIQAIRRIVDSR